MSSHCFMAYIVSDEKSIIIYTFVLLSIMSLLSSGCFLDLSLSLPHNNLVIMCVLI